MDYYDYGCRRVEKKDIDFWKEIIEDKDTLSNMNISHIVERYNNFWEYLNRVERFTVYQFQEAKETPIGGFSLYNRAEKEATFGYVIHPEFRGQGLVHVLMNLLFDTCRDLGIKTLKADVYNDNKASLRVLESNGFRKMDFLEKQL